MNLIYRTSPQVNLATNVFINVPVVLQFDDTPLISVVKEQSLGYTTQVPIYHADGTYLAKVNGTRVFATEAGKKAGVVIRDLPNVTVCEVAGRTVFEVFHQAGDAFRVQAELITPSGFFVKVAEVPMPTVLKSDGQSLQIGGMSMSECVFKGVRIGVWLKSDGSVAIGCT